MSFLFRPCRHCIERSRHSGNHLAAYHFSTSPLALNGTTTFTKLPSRDWSKYAPPPPPPRSPGASRAPAPSVNRSFEPRRRDDYVRNDESPRHRQQAFGSSPGSSGESRSGPRSRGPAIHLAGVPGREVRPEGLSKWGVRRDPPSNQDRDAGPQPAAFGLKRPDEVGQRRAWSDRGGNSGGGNGGLIRKTGPAQRTAKPEVTTSESPRRGAPDAARETASVVDTSLLADEDVGEESTDIDNRRRTLLGQNRRGGDRSRRAPLVEDEENSLPLRGGRGGPQEAAPERRKKEKVKLVAERKAEKEVFIPSTVAVERLAAIFDVKLFNLQTRMRRLDLSEDQRRPDYILTAEQACDIALEYGFNPVVDDEAAFDIFPEPEIDGEDPPLRPPVVTIMGHVDHGKTTLLDSLRHTSVAAGEAGGITQHIGAFSVPLSTLSPSNSAAKDATITFLDTPGHAAFTAMRARGTSVTDIVVLVVAADDGVMPQTKEVIELVKNEGDNVGLVVAINKVDKAGVDLARVKSALSTEGIQLEEDGGDVPSVKVSGLEKTGLDDLVETLSTLAELRDLRARQDGKAEGYVLESNVDRGRGNVATVLVTRGILRAGTSIVAGNTWCRVRQMQDDKGKSVRQALPGSPVSITGWRDLPSAGDQLLEAINGEEEAKRAISNRLRDAERRKLQADAEQINVKRREERMRAEAEDDEIKAVRDAGGNIFQAQLSVAKKAAELERGKTYKELRLVIKADVSGTVEAVVGSLEGIGNKEAGVKIVHTGVGEVGESDVSLAQAAEAIVIGFNVPCSRSIQNIAAATGVDLQLESVIYRLIETVRAKTAALLPPRIETRITGEATVLQLFPISVKRKESVIVAGCRVGNGTISRNEGVKILRGPERSQIYEGTIDTLKQVKKDANEVRKGSECGISFHGFNAVREGDEVVTFTTFEVPREL